jgi:acetyl esterase/lipase
MMCFEMTVTCVFACARIHAGAWYVHALRAAAVSTQWLHVGGAPHGIWMFVHCATSATIFNDIAKFVESRI